MNDNGPIKRNLRFAIFLMLILYVVGIFFYHNVEKWTFLDAAYFLTATFSTVGYGDITPQTEAGKLFTIFMLWIGISVGFYLIYSMMAYREAVVDKGLLDRLKMFRTLTSEKKNK